MSDVTAKPLCVANSVLRQAEQDRVAGDLVKEPRGRGRLHPVADLGNGEPAEVKGEVAMTERA
jgi:hypothetical protein